MESYTHRVHYYETDKMGIVHHSNYIRLMEEARVDFLDKIGFGFDTIEAMGILSPVTSVECHYKNTTRFADVITIDVWVEQFKGARLRINYLMKNTQGETVCEGASEHCFVDTDGKIIILKRTHPHIYSAIAAHIKE